MATLKDVARLANVDVSTVSRALNNTSYVHPETKKRIMAAVEQLSYNPNRIAQSLKKGKRQTIGIVVPGIDLNLFGGIVQEMEYHARRQGYSVLIGNTLDRPDSEEECLVRMRNGLVDGVVIASTGQNNRLLRDMAEEGIPVVQMVRTQDKRFSSVVADYYNCGYKGAKCLAIKGCRHIGFVGATDQLMPYKERYRGYCKAIRELKLMELTVDFPLSRDAGAYFQNGYAAVAQLLALDPALDGILAATDMQAIGVLRALRKAGIPVPGRVRVLSLTGHAIGGMVETAISSMEVPARDMGRKLVEMVLELIQAPAGQKPSTQHIVFDTTLVEREST